MRNLDGIEVLPVDMFWTEGYKILFVRRSAQWAISYRRDHKIERQSKRDQLLFYNSFGLMGQTFTMLYHILAYFILVLQTSS